LSPEENQRGFLATAELGEAIARITLPAVPECQKFVAPFLKEKFGFPRSSSAWKSDASRV